MTELSQIKPPTCWDCKNAKIYPGSYDTMEQPGDDPEVECQMPVSEDPPGPGKGVTEEILEKAHKDAGECPCYSPRPAGPCRVCSFEITCPQRDWKLYVDYYDRMYVCSEQCKEILTKQVEREEEYMNEEVYDPTGILLSETQSDLDIEACEY